jgi:hypothetical protein
MDERDGLQICTVAVNILNRQSRRADKQWFSLDKELITPHSKRNSFLWNVTQGLRTGRPL